MTIPEVVGTYGAILSTIVAYRQWRSSRPRIVITTMPAFNGPGSEPVGNYVRAVVANHGASTVHIRQAYVLLLMDWATWHGRLRGLVFRRGRWRSFEQLSMPLPAGTIVAPPLGTPIEPGQSLVIWIQQVEYERLRYGPRANGIQIGIQDETDRNFISPPVRQFGVPALPDNGVPRGA